MYILIADISTNVSIDEPTIDYTKGVFQSLDSIFEVFNLPKVSKYRSHSECLIKNNKNTLVVMYTKNTLVISLFKCVF